MCIFDFSCFLVCSIEIESNWLIFDWFQSNINAIPTCSQSKISINRNWLILTFVLSSASVTSRRKGMSCRAVCCATVWNREVSKQSSSTARGSRRGPPQNFFPPRGSQRLLAVSQDSVVVDSWMCRLFNPRRSRSRCGRIVKKQSWSLKQLIDCELVVEGSWMCRLFNPRRSRSRRSRLSRSRGRSEVTKRS